MSRPVVLPRLDEGGPTTPSDVDVAEPRRRRFASPYTLRENLDWLWNFCFGPSRKNHELTPFVPAETELNAIRPQVTIAFAGDMMPTLGREFHVGSGLREFLSSADYLVLNLEGVISDDRHVWNSLRHEASITTFLESVFTAERTVIGCANNHAADCGRDEFNRSSRLLEERGFSVIGSRDRSSVLLADRVQITACTYWSNQACSYLTRPEDAVVEAGRNAGFKILYPHWGYELHLYPSTRQIACARQLLGSWDMILGHHSHCPQPITQYGEQLVAYSLGNLGFGIRADRWHHGMIVKATLGPSVDGRWRVGRVAWTFTRQWPDGPRGNRIDVVDRCSFFPPDAIHS